MKTLLVSACSCAGDLHTPGWACSYRVSWQINPHMKVGQVDPRQAQQQHAVYLGALRRLGADLVELPFVHGAFDSIFAKDSAVVRGDGARRRALLGNPRFVQRKAEQHERTQQLAARGFEVEEVMLWNLEGGDVVSSAGIPFALLGHGFRSERAAARTLARFLDREVVPLELRDPALYHLDTALAVLDDGAALVCEEAFTAAALHTLRRLPFTALYRVPYHEALALSLNFVELGGCVVSGSDGVASGVETARILRAHGLSIVAVPLSQFHLAGGSAGCLSASVIAASAQDAVAEAA